jgi:hypothetical protein
LNRDAARGYDPPESKEDEMPDAATIGGTDPLAWIEPIVYGLGAAVLVLWLCMPFAIFGTKRLLREQAKLLEALVTEQRRANELLYRLSVEEPVGDPREPVLTRSAEAPARAPAAPEAGRREPAPGSRMSLVVDRSDRVL